MNRLLACAAALAFIVGLVHSVLGEALIFRRMRTGGVVPTNGARVIGEGHVRILWASWHVLTALGWCIAAILLWLAVAPVVPAAPAAAAASSRFISNAIVIAMLAGSALVLVGTKARHPGWIGLLGVAVLTWFATA